MNKVTELSLPKMGKVDNYFIAGDWHTEGLCPKTFAVLIAHAKMFPLEQRRLIINGDFVDCEFLMARDDFFKKWIKRNGCMDEYFVPKAQEEFKWANDTLDALQSVFSEIILVEGNHDWRYRWFREQSSLCPMPYKNDFNLENQLKLDKRGIKFIEYNDWLDIGNLAITHGMYHGATACKKHYEAAHGKNVIFSHVHKYECKPFIARGKTIYSRSIGAMSKLSPYYIKNRSTDWDNGYGQFFMFSDGSHIFHNHLINNGVLVLPDGTIFNGNAC